MSRSPASWASACGIWACAIRRHSHRLGRSPADWAEGPGGNTKKIAATFREACSVAADHGERLAGEGEICWGGMHSWKDMINTLEETDRPQTIGFQADMAHTLLYHHGLQRAEVTPAARQVRLEEQEAFSTKR